MEEPVQKPVNPADQQAPISSVRTEIERPVANYIQHSETAPIIAPEVKEAGVEATPNIEPNLTQEHFDVGIRHSPEAVKLVIDSVNPAVNIKLPMTQFEAVAAEKGKDDDSGTFLGTLLAKIYRRLGVLKLRETNA